MSHRDGCSPASVPGSFGPRNQQGPPGTTGGATRSRCPSSRSPSTDRRGSGRVPPRNRRLSPTTSRRRPMRRTTTTTGAADLDSCGRPRSHSSSRPCWSSVAGAAEPPTTKRARNRTHRAGESGSDVHSTRRKVYSGHSTMVLWPGTTHSSRASEPCQPPGPGSVECGYRTTPDPSRRPPTATRGSAGRTTGRDGLSTIAAVGMPSSLLRTSLPESLLGASPALPLTRSVVATGTTSAAWPVPLPPRGIVAPANILLQGRVLGYLPGGVGACPDRPPLRPPNRGRVGTGRSIPVDTARIG